MYKGRKAKLKLGELLPRRYLNVVPYNQAAKALYESFDFRCLAHYPNFYWIDGQQFDGELYCRYLCPPCVVSVARGVFLNILGSSRFMG